MFRKKYLFLYFPLILFWLTPLSLFAVEISRFSGVPVKGDIALSPAKVELSLDPGTQSVQYLDVINRMGQDAVFSVDVEDFSPSEDIYGSVILDKTVDGLNSSLKRYIKLDPSEFTLSHGEQARIPVIISLPKGARPGGLYGAVLVSGSPLKNESGATKVVTRLGSLFFVKVNGSVSQSGILKGVSFHDNKIEIVFENNGDIYLNPYGIINIYDDSKKLVKKIDVDPWFVLPNSTRIRTVTVGDLATGAYTANISINRGYDNVIDSNNLSFDFSSPSGKSFYLVGGFFLVVCLVLLMAKFRII